MGKMLWIMKKKTNIITCAIALVSALMLAMLLCACSTTGTTASSSSASGSSVSSSEASSSSSSASGFHFSLFGFGEEDTYVTVESAFNYASGIHHAELIFDGYADEPIEIEIYAHSASQTAKKFCTLVDKGYYNGKPIFWILNEMYMRAGNPTQDNNLLITGEYEESDVKNSNSLKKGVLALNRAEDGQQSDASSFFICMSDLSYLDRKYAAFAKITKNYEVVEKIAERTSSNDPGMKIDIDDTGKVLDDSKAPHIQSITMID